VNPWTDTASIGLLVSWKVLIHPRLSREVAGGQGIAHAEPEQGVLEASGLTGEEEAPATDLRVGRLVAKSPEGSGIAQRDAYFALEEIDAPREVLLVVVKIVEHARRERRTAPADQQVRIACGCEFIRDGAKSAIAPVRREDIAHRDRIHTSWSERHDSAVRQVLDVVPELNLDTFGQRLSLERLIQRPGVHAAPHEVPQWFRRSALVLSSIRIEQDTLAKKACDRRQSRCRTKPIPRGRPFQLTSFRGLESLRGSVRQHRDAVRRRAPVRHGEPRQPQPPGLPILHRQWKRLCVP
jgi:hypothetical protein